MSVNYKALALGLGSVLLAASCSNDEIERVNQGPEVTFNTAVSRAANITTANLSEFKVWGQAVNYTSNMIINGQIAKKQKDQNYFKIDDPVYWPSDIAKIDFWGVSPSDVAITMEAQTKEIKNFTPAPQPNDQKDLIVAYEQASRSQGTSVRLTFNHALSQIVVKAKRGQISVGTDKTDETKEVLIKGAWIVNVLPTGTLAFNKNVGEEKHYMEWTPRGAKTSYGAEFSQIVNLSGHNDHDVLEYAEEAEKKNNNLMLVPQKLDSWDLDDDIDKTANSSKGAYILLLCRVTTTHDGGTHESAENTGGVQVGENSHKHQLFPYTGNFDEQEYGYTCIPINTVWEPGKKYIYTLEFCGPTSGAGVYPNPVDLASFPNGGGKYIKQIPDVEPMKTIGDPVLDQPIRFTVDVENWTNGWVSGDDEDTGGGNMGMK